jgi:hypothetical protein
MSPLTDHYDILTRRGLRRTGPSEAVVLSVNAESPVILRHQQLGYAVNLNFLVLTEVAGPAVRQWLLTAFEPIKRTPYDIRRDYRELIEAVRARSDTKFLILNAMSTSGDEDVFSYAPFDRPMDDTLSSIRAKELNLMLHDLAREQDISIVDVDAIAAELGGAAHLPDGVHQSGLMQAEVRAEILQLLRGRGVPGFGAPPAQMISNSTSQGSNPSEEAGSGSVE